MDRKKALATAGAATATALAATIALGANLGLFGLTSSDTGPGSFEPVEVSKTTPRTEVIDVPVPIEVPQGSAGSGAPTGGPIGEMPTPPAPALASEPDDVATAPADDDSDEIGEHDEHEDEHEDSEQPGHEDSDEDD